MLVEDRGAKGAERLEVALVEGESEAPEAEADGNTYRLMYSIPKLIG